MIKYLITPIDLIFFSIEQSEFNGETKSGPGFSAGVPCSKSILNSVSGRFLSGEVSAILGSSGAGKTTLLNVLAGYVRVGVTGSIKTNGVPIQQRSFHKLSAYIMQDDIMHRHVTVQEIMMMAANLKLGKEMNNSEKKKAVEEIVAMIGLEQCRDTMTHKLSGGQKKRLSVALELVNNPPVIFLDEPTTGLDTVSIKQMVSLLKTLALRGRTIICTIHQPTASIYQQFDHVYVLGRGQCVYQGSQDQLVPFLSSVGFNCPITYNPADYVIECIHGEKHDNVRILALEMCNGKLSRSKEKQESVQENHNCQDAALKIVKTKKEEAEENSIHFATSFLTQFSILFKRMMLQKVRNVTTLMMALFAYTSCGGLIGYTFAGVGENGDRMFENYRFLLVNMVFVGYLASMGPVLTIPTIITLVKREYFNRWYGLRAYFVALALHNTLNVVFLSSLYLGLTYYLSGQILELERFLWYLLFYSLMVVVCEAVGECVGFHCSETNGSFIAMVSLVAPTSVTFYGLGYGSMVAPGMKFLISLSFVRASITGVCLGLFEDRQSLNCNNYIGYCHFKEPKVFLRDLGMSDTCKTNQLFVILVVYAFCNLLAYFVLNCRVNADLRSKVRNIVVTSLKTFGLEPSFWLSVFKRIGVKP